MAAAAGSTAVTVNKIVPKSANQQQNVMVIDEGIDVSVSDLAGKVAAAYTETCAMAQISDAAAGAGRRRRRGPAFDALKQKILRSWSQPDDSCHLTSGISAKPDPLASIGAVQSALEPMVRENKTVDRRSSLTEYEQLMARSTASSSTFGYHGTATSSTVAHENPNVRLVLVERQLGSETSLRPTSLASRRRTSTRPSSS